MFYNKKIFERCFMWRGKYWYKNIKEIPLYFKQLHYLIKHGYDVAAKWSTFDWFIDTMKSILPIFRSNHHGYPVVSFDDGELQEQSEKEYDADIDRMIELLDYMDEWNSVYHTDEYENGWDFQKVSDKMYASKDEFFKLFAKHFYSLWD